MRIVKLIMEVKKMKIGDVVNIKKQGGGYWKGQVTDISEGYNEDIGFIHPISTINEINGPGHAVITEKDLKFENGEYSEL